MSREFDEAESLQEEYDTFALFAQDIEFETEGQIQRVQKELDKPD
jgi:hypothetical protein